MKNEVFKNNSRKNAILYLPNYFLKTGSVTRGEKATFFIYIVCNDTLIWYSEEYRKLKPSRSSMLLELRVHATQGI